MTGTGDSITANSGCDPMFAGEDIHRYASAYLGHASQHDPLASPLFGDFAGLPPLLLQVGRKEVLLDDARAVHAKAVAARRSSKLQIFDRVFHGWHFGAPFVPESRVALREINAFINRHSG
jgi:acetyl esterase/lipase